MKVIDAGHRYELDTLDGNGHTMELGFVKRMGDKYPSNTSAYPGTTIQEVLRALIDRGEYVNRQMPCDETEECIALWRRSLRLIELRAAKRHDRALSSTDEELASGASKCVSCGHIGCANECGKDRL